MISGLLSYKLAKNFFGIQGFAEYSMGKRVIAMLYPIFLLGLGVGITRFVSVFIKDDRQRVLMFIASVFILSVSSIFLILAFLSLKSEISIVFFNSKSYGNLIFPLALTILGLLWHSLAYSYYRGKLEIKKANLIQIINIGIIPVVIFIISENLQQVFFFNGILVLVISLLIIINLIIKEKLLKYNINIHDITQFMKKLFLYSIGRLPGDIALAAIFALIPVFVTHIATVKEGGVVAFGLSLVSLAASFFATIGIVMLPKIGVLYSEKNYSQIKKYISKILQFSIVLPVIGVFLFWVFGDEILNLYLGDDMESYSYMIKLIIVAIIPYVIYVSLRSVLDAIYEKPYNTFNVLISLILLITFGFLLYFFHAEYRYIIFLFILDMCILSFLTLVQILKIRKFA